MWLDKDVLGCDERAGEAGELREEGKSEDFNKGHVHRVEIGESDGRVRHSWRGGVGGKEGGGQTASS